MRDLQETILNQLGLDAHRFTYPFVGLNQRLIGPTEEAQLIKGILGYFIEGLTSVLNGSCRQRWRSTHLANSSDGLWSPIQVGSLTISVAVAGIVT